MTPVEKLDATNITAGRENSCNSDHKVEEGGWELWFDGAALPNPGRVGLGVFLVSPDKEQFERSAIGPQIGCNNEAELQALIFGLALARSYGAKRIKVHGDSDFAVRAAKEDAIRPITSIPRLRVLINRLTVLIQEYDEVFLQWIPRHRNGCADRLSRQVLGLPDKPAIGRKAVKPR